MVFAAPTAHRCLHAGGEHAAQLGHQPSDLRLHAKVAGFKSLQALSAPGCSKTLSSIHHLMTGNSTDRAQKPTANLSDVSARPAAPAHTPGVGSPQVRSASVQAPAVLPSAAAPTLLGRPSSEPKCTTANPVRDKDSDATPLPKCCQSYQWQWSPWLLSSPLQQWCQFTGSLTDPRESGTAAALQWEAASMTPYHHHSSPARQVHARAQMYSVPGTHSAGYFPELPNLLHSDHHLKSQLKVPAVLLLVINSAAKSATC